jgi:hypothetical protein
MGDSILEECRARLGPAPRRFSWYDRATYLFTPKPQWAKGDDLETFFTHRAALLREGIVVWGHVVQANSLMYRREEGITGGPNCPGEVVYSPDSGSDVSPAELMFVARALFALKGTTQDDAESQSFSDYLANERVRVFGKPVPKSLSPQYPCLVSTVFFEREHLPGDCLRQSFFPLLLSPQEPRVAMPLPARYWPKTFTVTWEKR